ncbi:hypothetical protein [Mycolicibacterium mengxianglii]|uniref:hypothetical protein n=1 Tax=Mycolicibacterium mengxianglii TaxID=2736649 RepID=UPI0018D190D4|nr:hypothetical protein [Mycolicibacterium mengxianglii]
MIAVVSVAVAVGAWFRPVADPKVDLADSAPTYTDRQISDAKSALCDAHQLANRATHTVAARKSDDAVVTYIVATNVRLSATASAEYMLQKLSDHPASPVELSGAIRALAVAYQRITLLHLADAADAELDVAYNELDTTDARVVRACE